MNQKRAETQLRDDQCHEREENKLADSSVSTDRSFHNTDVGSFINYLNYNEVAWEYELKIVNAEGLV